MPFLYYCSHSSKKRSLGDSNPGMVFKPETGKENVIVTFKIKENVIFVFFCF